MVMNASINYTFNNHTINASYLGVSNSTTYNITASTTYNISLYSFKPTQGTPVLNASDNPYNTTYANLTCYNQSTSDPEGDTVTNIYNWYIGEESLTPLNMPFNTNVSNTADGAVKDYSGNNNNGTLKSTGTHYPVWTADGRVGGAYDFDGTESYIEIASSGSLEFDFPIALEVWIKLDDVSGEKGIIGKKDPIDAGDGYFLKVRDEHIEFYGSGGTSANSFSVLKADTWHHIVVVAYESTATIYIDGDDQTENSAIDQIAQNKEPLFIGSLAAKDLFFRGEIDEVKIYRSGGHVLTAAQVAQLYADSKNGYSSSSTIVSEQTTEGETWRCNVTPNDALQDGDTNSSNDLLIEATSISFTVTLPASGCTNGKGCVTGGCSACTRAWIETTDLTGPADETCVMPQGQTGGTAFLDFLNTGNVHIDWTMALNDSLSSQFALMIKNGTDSCPTSSTVTTSFITVQGNVAQNSHTYGWLYGNFTSAPYGNQTRDLNHTSQES
jgi:hypothetical protein